jgi:hypothetical protein
MSFSLALSVISARLAARATYRRAANAEIIEPFDQLWGKIKRNTTMDARDFVAVKRGGPKLKMRAILVFALYPSVSFPHINKPRALGRRGA